MNRAMATFKFSKPLSFNVTNAETTWTRDGDHVLRNGIVVAMLSFYICLASFSLLSKVILIVISP